MQFELQSSTTVWAKSQHNILEPRSEVLGLRLYYASSKLFLLSTLCCSTTLLLVGSVSTNVNEGSLS